MIVFPLSQEESPPFSPPVYMRDRSTSIAVKGISEFHAKASNPDLVPTQMKVWQVFQKVSLYPADINSTGLGWDPQHWVLGATNSSYRGRQAPQGGVLRTFMRPRLGRMTCLLLLLVVAVQGTSLKRDGLWQFGDRLQKLPACHSSRLFFFG